MGLGGLTVVADSEFCLGPVDQPQKNWETIQNHKRVFWEQANPQALHLQAEMADSGEVGMSQTAETTHNCGTAEATLNIWQMDGLWMDRWMDALL